MLDSKGLTQLKFSEMMGVDPSQTAKWVMNHNTPYQRTRYKMSEVLNVKFLQLEQGWGLEEIVRPAPSVISEPATPYMPLPSTTATLEDLERMLELVESTVRIARASIIELRKKS